MNRWTVAATAAAVLGTATASAQSGPAAPAFYLVGSVGVAQHDIDGAGISRQLTDLGYLGARTSVSNDKTAWRIGAGWQAHRHLAVELSYFDLGKPGYASTAARPGSFDARIEVTGWSLDLVPQYAFANNLGVFARLGYARTDSSADFSAGGAFRLAQPSADRKHDGWNAGLGVSYSFNRNLSLRGEWTYMPDLGDETMGGKWDANVFTLSALWRF